MVHRDAAATVDAPAAGAMAMPEVRMRDQQGKITITPERAPAPPPPWDARQVTACSPTG